MVCPRRKSSKNLPGVVLVMTFLVMAGLDPSIHVFIHRSRNKTWMAGTRPGMTNVRTHAHLQSPSPPWRCDWPGSHGRSDEAHRLDERAPHGHPQHLRGI